jgi:hypothetical protein
MLLRNKSIIIVLIIFVGWSCKNEELELSSSPMLDLTTNITGLPGQEIVFSGVVSDPAGVMEVELTYAPWELAKTIEVDRSITQYELAYTFEIPATTAMGSTHLVTAIARNPAGNETKVDITVVISGDDTAPVIDLASPNDEGTYIIGAGAEFNLTFSVTDDQSISTVRLVGLGLNETIVVDDSSYTFDQPIDFSIVGNFPISITATDAAGNISERKLSVSIENSLRFGQMYLADVDTEAKLLSDAFGVPMLIDGIGGSTDSAGVFFQAHYYNATPNTEIRFIPQKSSFSPFALGAGEEQGQLALGNDASVSPIVLPEVGYYRIVLNLMSLSYTMELYTPTEPTHEYIIMMGTGVRVNGQSTCVSNEDGSEACWWFGSGKQLTKDPNNPYRFYGDVELFDFDPESDASNGFILGANLADWSPFWRFDQGDAVDLEPEATVPGGGLNYIFSAEKYGNYYFEFDTHLNRARLVPQ